MQAANGSVRVIINPISTQFEAVRGAEAVGVLAYERAGKRFDLRHTFVPKSQRGQGVAGALVKGALDAIRVSGGAITPSCTYVESFVQAHPEYADLIDPEPFPRREEPSAAPSPLADITDRTRMDLVNVQIDEIASNRLVLRPWSLDDTDSALPIYQDEEVVRWTLPPIGPEPDRNAMRRRIDGWISESNRAPHPQGRWAIELADSGALVGGTSLFDLALDGVEVLTMSWELASSATGHGLAAEAGHALLHFAFQLSNARAVHSVVQRGNRRGVATLQRLGMVRLSGAHLLHGREVDLYAVNRDDLELSAARRSLSLTD
ncbi:GNAT family N-acetyltransferase [Nocardioides sp. YIM 152315]|uniref:GNAT family N-acetyltransferase n=1 Tax=Nocardioides sp. YIM 152315 TaxID=3031760 RepID=UPI0023DCBC1E|nr:GNAT family N-acetyltransferase [Nocardioides sp. YIM 152315]MDF1606329.1 GNAT family N-acetyltransferase [Nocardioides sp. YIM 152315]